MAADRIDTGRECSLNILYMTDEDTSIAGAVFSLYRVASVSEQGEFTPEPEFKKYVDYVEGGLDEPGWHSLANVLPGYVVLDPAIQPYRNKTGEYCTGAVDEKGWLTFGHLETGLYLVMGQSTELGNNFFGVKYSMVSLPTLNVQEVWDYDPIISPKEEYIGSESINLTVQKSWSGDNETERPAQITVQLLRDGELMDGDYATVILNKDNNWEHTWIGLPPDSYTVVENPVPDGYTPSYERKENLVIIVNTKPAPGGGKLPQTGLLWWPVPVLALAGMTLFLAGWIRSRRNEG